MKHRECTFALIKKGKSTRENLLKIAENIERSYNIECQKINGMLSDIFDGVIHPTTIRAALPEKYKARQRSLFVCEKCGKRKIKSLSRHMKNSHSDKQKKAKLVQVI